MAEVQERSNDSPGIKLFGATILIKEATEAEGDRKGEEDRKRPDKIVACPRCKSTETKFCYFNNYNVNQPRHFCRGCQRYWTAGGALRNVPIGAGRRKNKPPCGELLSEGSSGGEEWRRAAEDGGKRRRCDSDSQTC